MNIVTWNHSPWGEPVIIHAAWWLLWISVAAAVIFMIIHTVWTAKNTPAKVSLDAAARAEGLPEKIKRHSAAARLFHWVAAASVLTLLITAFLPKTGVLFSWLNIHLIAGVVFIAAILFHIVHVFCCMDFAAIWPVPKDLKEIKDTFSAPSEEGHKPSAGKYPIGNKMYHLAIFVVGLIMAVTGFVMLWRVHTIMFTRDPYVFFSDAGWGIIYAIHGLGGISLVMLVIVHIYFAIRPEKRAITESMLTGFMRKDFFVTHHDPDRWSGNDK